MTKIDWTKPVETDEKTPQPVRVLAQFDWNGDACILIEMPNGMAMVFSAEGKNLAAGVTLRNVAPSKPEPGLWEAWVVFKGPSNYWVFPDYAHAKNSADANGFPMARAAVMPDGSPVPGEDNYWRDYAGKMADAADRAEEDNNSLKAERDSAVYDFRQAMEIVRQYAIEMKELKAEIVRMTSQ